MDLRLELITVPVSDVDRAKTFYVDQVGFTVGQDVRVDERHRFVELVPPGSPCATALTRLPRFGAGLSQRTSTERGRRRRGSSVPD